ncbi:monocarboxylate transporter 7-like isoform X3 [Lampetra fluviatilis]
MRNLVRCVNMATGETKAVGRGAGHPSPSVCRAGHRSSVGSCGVTRRGGPREEQEEEENKEAAEEAEEEAMGVRATDGGCGRAVGAARRPDGGWGWAVAAAFFVVEALSYGTIKAFAVFFNDLLAEFSATPSAVSWVMSICVFTMTFTGPVSTVLSNRFGSRPVVMLGGLLSCAGFVGASFARSITDMYISIGLVSGLGFCLSFVPTVTALSLYFERRRALVMAVASTGECFAMFAFAPGFHLLKESMGWRNAILVIGAMQLNITVCGALLRPLPERSQPERRREATDDGGVDGTDLSADDGEKSSLEARYKLENEQTVRSVDSGDSGDSGINVGGAVPPTARGKSDDGRPESRQSRSGLELAKPPGGTGERAKLLDFALLREPQFVCYALFGLFATLGFFAPQMFLVPLCVSLGLAEQQAAYLLSTMAVAEVGGRVTAGALFGRRPLPALHLELCCVCGLALVLLGFPLVSDFWGLAACSALFGLAFGMVASTHIPLLAEDDVVGVARMSSGVGIYFFTQSFAGLTGPPIAGWLVEATQRNYAMAFYTSAGGVALGAAFLALVRPCRWRRRRGQARAGPGEEEPGASPVVDIPLSRKASEDDDDDAFWEMDLPESGARSGAV